MAKKFSELEAKMSPGSRARSDAKAKEMLDAMTKPSYEELKCGHPAELLIKSVESDYQFCELCEMRSERNDAVQMEAHYKAENLRVRGLLQRQWISVEERLPELRQVVIVSHVGFVELSMRGLDGEDWFWCEPSGHIEGGFYDENGDSLVTHWQPLPEPPTFPQSSSLVPQGAESADIGKLDSADKSGVEMGKVNRVDDKKSDDGLRDTKLCERCGHIMQNFERWLHVDGFVPYKECYRPAKCLTLDLPKGILGQRCGQCDSVFPNGNFKFCSECGAHLVYAMEG